MDHYSTQWHQGSELHLHQNRRPSLRPTSHVGRLKIRENSSFFQVLRYQTEERRDFDDIMGGGF
jgi:hypothetical protein